MTAVRHAIVPLAAATSLALGIAIPAHAGKTLDAVKARGEVICGVNTSAPGFSSTDRVEEMRQLGAGQYLRKPYTRDSLAKAIHPDHLECVAAGPERDGHPESGGAGPNYRIFRAVNPDGFDLHGSRSGDVADIICNADGRIHHKCGSVGAGQLRCNAALRRAQPILEGVVGILGINAMGLEGAILGIDNRAADI